MLWNDDVHFYYVHFVSAVGSSAPCFMHLSSQAYICLYFCMLGTLFNFIVILRGYVLFLGPEDSGLVL